MKRLSLLLAAIMLLCMQSCGQRVEQQTSLESEKNLTDVRLRQDVTFLQRYAYKAWYSETMRIPLAVSWYLTGNHVTGSYRRKGVAFHPDEEVKGSPVTTFDYMQSGYSRGHMCPSGDNKWSQRAQEESFLMTNICPQNGKLNGGDWNDLEVQCRTWAKRYDRVYIVLRTGKYPAAIGFIYENNGSNQPMGQAVRSVDEIEQLTGMDFFSALDDDIENRIEAKSNISDW